jgi:hypothetical protein
MTSTISISGNIHPNNLAFHTLITMLEQLDIHVAHPSADEPLLYSGTASDAWRQHDREVALFETIGAARFHIMYNDDAINETAGRQILYAMAKHRSILMTGTPTFTGDISPFTRDTILAHVQQFHSINLPELDIDELKVLISKLTQKDYRLAEGEKVLINSRIKAHFRRLLERAREIYVE